MFWDILGDDDISLFVPWCLEKIASLIQEQVVTDSATVESTIINLGKQDSSLWGSGQEV